MTGARSVTVVPPDPSDIVSCTVVARQGGKEVGSQSAPVYLEGAEQGVLNAIRDGRFSQPLHSASPVTYLHAISSPGDYIGQGKTYSYDAGGFTAQRDYRGFNVSAGGFTFHFGGPGNSFLTAREYLDAKRHPFSNDAPGIEISGNGRGCNTIAGKFVVWEFATRGNEVLRLAIDFTQRCEAKNPPFYGRIRINSNFH
jgi:hypothetical protein